MSKLQSGAPRNPITKAIQEYGRIAKNLSLLRYLHDNAHRRRIHRQLNKGEAIHALRKDIFYANRGEIRKRHEHEQDTQTLCLNLLTNAVIAWNTIYIGRIHQHLASSDTPLTGRASARVEERRYTPLGNRHIACGHLDQITDRINAVLSRAWGIMTITIDDHFSGKPDSLRELFAEFEEAVRTCGTYDLAIAKSAISFKGSVRGFAGITPRKKWLSGFLDLTEECTEEPFTSVIPYTKKLFVHRFVLRESSDISPQFRSRIAEAYRVGQGGHHEPQAI